MAGGTESPTTSSGVYIVEKILDKRVRRGRTEYFLKWAGFKDTDNSWEPARNVSTTLIMEYETRMAEAKKERESSGTAPAESPNGLQRGLQPYKILSACKFQQQTLCLLQYKEPPYLVELVPVDEVFAKDSLLVLKFYEQYIPDNPQ